MIIWFSLAKGIPYHRIGWWENLQENPINLMVKTCKNHGFRLRFPQQTNPLLMMIIFIMIMMMVTVLYNGYIMVI